MTNDQYRDALATLGLTQGQAGKCFGYTIRTSQAYALGESPIPEPVARLILLILEWGINPRKIPHAKL